MSPLITPAQLIAEPGDVIVVDVRHDLSNPTAGLLAYAAGHLPNAAFLSVDEDLAGDASRGNGGRHPLPRPEDFVKRLAELGANDQTLLVAYDASGAMFAARFLWLCRWIGHPRVAVLDGGLQAWVQEGGLLSSEEYKPRRKGRLGLRPTLCPRWGLDVVEEWVKSGSDRELAVLLDARAAERFRGEVEPIDPVAGHIPGALNRPYALNLSEQGRFKAPDALKSEFETLLEGADPSSVVHTCGSGISACHNLLAMEAAGLVGSALYPGSWSEWCARGAKQPAV